MENVDRKSLLLVEDEAVIAIAQKRALEKCGYAVVVAPSGEAAVAACEGSAFDLVLMDINLGKGMDGTEAAKTIIARRNLPVVFLSSHTEPEVVGKTEEITPYGYVIKNSGLPVLEASIKMAFKLHEADRKLTAEKERLATLLDSIGDAVIAADRLGYVTQLNPLAERLTGFRAAEAVGMPLREALGAFGNDSPFSAAGPGPDFMDAWKGGTDRGGRAALRREGGEIRVSLSSAPVRDPRGGIAGVVLVLRDVTEEYKAQEALRLRENYLTAIIENQPGLVWLKDAESRFLAVNTAFLKACGLTSPAELIGKTDLDLWPRELAEKYRADDRAVLESRSPRIAEEEIYDGGSPSWFETFKTPILDAEGRAIGTTGYSRDITRRKGSEEDKRLAEDALRYKSVFLEAVANSSADGILVVDLTGKKILQNDRTLELWKIPREVADDPDGMRQVAHVMAMTKNPKQFLDEIEHQKVSPLEITMDQLELVDGTVLDRHSAPVLGPDGRNYGRIYHFHDVTGFREAEAKIRGLLAEKEIILKEAHHRVKNYMSTLQGLLSLQAASLTEESAIMALQDAQSRIQSMVLLYDKLYVSASFGSISTASYLPFLVEEIIDNFPKRAEVSVEERVDDFILDARTMQVLAIIVNELLTNIMKYAFEGRSEGRIVLTAAIAGGEVELVVEDDGVGLPEGVELDGSAGFGLRLVGMLAKQLDGSIVVDRQAGTKFTLRFRI